MATAMGRRVLLTGDIDADAERKLVVSTKNLLGTVNILKLAHHGSKTSSSAPFMDRTQASLGLISCGLGNRYGHPSIEVLNRLTERGIPLIRTDRTGAVVITFGDNILTKLDFPGSPKPASRGR
jgi:competence protein ComEC